MHLRLTVTSSQAAMMGDLAVRDFDASGGTIGRAPENAWVLQDTEQVLSRHHARINFANGRFTLTDTSTNGVVVNGELLVRDQPRVLHDGDRVTIGDYEFAVTMTDDQAVGAGTDPFAAADPFADLMPPAPKPPTPEPLTGDTGQFGDAADASRIEETVEAELDPLKFLDSQGLTADTPRESADKPSGVQPIGERADHSRPEEEFFRPQSPPPEPVSSGGEAIPDDYDPLSDLSLGGPAGKDESKPADAKQPGADIIPDWLDMPSAEPAPPPPPQESTPPPPKEATPPPPPRDATPPPQVAPPPQESTPSPQPEPGPAPTPASLQSAVELILRGAGLPMEQLPDQEAEQFLEATGRIFREITDGMMKVLRARSQLKNEFRMPRTEIRPVENNPLKFTVNADEALHTLLFPRSDAYLGPSAAFRDGFDDITAHQVAMVAGTRAAFAALLQRFDPQTLQEQWHNETGGIDRLNPNAVYWRKFREMYSRMTRDSGDHIQRLFGEEFARAYEDQIIKLQQGR